jgi:uncharacterized membrane protein (UPF0127 family)
MRIVSIPFDRHLRAGFLALLATAALAMSHDARADGPALKSIAVKIGTHPLKVEVATTEEQRARGLMFRKSMPRDVGMLFTFDEPGYHAMWMKNTLIPLSVAFIDHEGRILNILDMEPETLDSHAASGPARYAIETNKGWFAERRIKAGEKVSGLPRLP